MKIGFDIDGVLADFMSVLLKKLREDYTASIKMEHCRTYDYVYCAMPELSKSQLSDYIVSLIWLESIPAYPYAAEVLVNMFGRGGHLDLVTARPPVLREKTQKWVKDNIGLHANIHHIHSRDKAETLRAEKVDVFVEDRLRTANHIAEVGRTKAILVNRPWNVGREAHKDVIRINDLRELPGVLKVRRAA